ncbi:MAG TPA: biotin/lipoyl-containing protein [Candidatus Limnocylindrales bacterium]|nr:biotin/lipoyl-containing protein [Candidatus Limnocylindrales bacterium]
MSETGLAADGALVDPVAVGPGGTGANGHTDGVQAAAELTTEGAVDGAAATPEPAVSLSSADASLLSLIDRLSTVLERGDLGELEVSSGGTTIILRAPSAIAPVAAVAAAVPLTDAPGAGAALAGAATAVADAPGENAAPAQAASKPSVKAPLTGLYYGAPSPGATPYVAVGDHVSVGQIIGLIEAMKLFNEIKSDLSGRVTRICVDNGALVKAKQPLIEVEPA